MEVNFDGIVGPTHNYSGLSYGNVASVANQKRISNPKEAALQGLKKMKFLADLGLKQAILLPHERPHIPTLRAFGYQGSDAEIIRQAMRENPELFQACTSAAAMWTANAATVSPSSDTEDKKVHLTPANLNSKLHRSIEAPITYTMLQKIFKDEKYFTIHHPIPFYPDEGAANHTRFSNGLHLFVYGKNVTNKYPPRQSLEAFQAIVRNHRLDPQKVIFAQQNPAAIDAGVFHNDVISVGNRDLFFYHEKAFVDTAEVIKNLQDIQLLEVSSQDISLEEAVASYLFNSQILTLPDGKTILLAPEECKTIPSVDAFIKRIPQNLIHKVYFMNLRESMLNGGGPACLRLRVELREEELAAMHPDILLTHELYLKIEQWINKHYRDRLSPHDLGDPELLRESHQALDELTQMLSFGSLYDFQKRT